MPALPAPINLSTSNDYASLAARIKAQCRHFGLHALGIAGIDLTVAEAQLAHWLRRECHGTMAYMSAHGTKRTRPAELLPGTRAVLCATLNYWPANAYPAHQALADAEIGYVSRYALGRDYHKTLRQRLARLAAWIAQTCGEPVQYRVFTDSAPVMEKPLAAHAGLGWMGKHTNLLRRDGSWFFLGEIYLSLPLPADAPQANHCGRCQACIAACPTAAIIAPYQLDARRCLSYWTIEAPGAIPIEFRPALGNRIYGCDDCQLVCPWNRCAPASDVADFAPRHGLDRARLVDLFAWSEAEFLRNTEGSPLRRLGHARWLRNLAVALGNAPPSAQARHWLQIRCRHDCEWVREHSAWALAQGDGHSVKKTIGRG